MFTPPCVRWKLLLWALTSLPIAACGGSVVVDKSAPESKAGDTPTSPKSASGSAGSGSAGSGSAGSGSAASGSAGSGSAGSGSAGSGSAGAPAQLCCNVAFSCDPGDEQQASAACPSGASCYARPACCNVTYCAHRVTLDGGAGLADAAPPPQAECSLIGTWHAHSMPWKGLPTDAQITFASDGTLSGVPGFVGKWSIGGSQLIIQDTVGADMTCSFADSWTLTFSPDCWTAPLLPIGSGCTGARRYLDWDVTLTRD